ncbi:tetratricopeptide repeat protein [Pelagibacterium lacus]|uniref:Uncharacterized protein n=1 Tax=Pelagibacterium lacus TaxID=2282655 RepID=A0A369W3Y4_9HYPH|nr:hypothetical protein [Pelagibacterium lacus]RDE08717.1 hypothetical protein DVH29_09750 [Pelagibacterium lacus]
MPDGGESGREEEEAVRAALAELTAWEPLRRSPQLSAFLTYVVVAALRGEGESIKAYSIAVDVFGRGEDFDPQTDPIVRVQAQRLRRLLERFNASGLGQSSMQIAIPRGRYVPQFLPRQGGADAAPPIPAPAGPEGTEPAGGSGRAGKALWAAGTLALLLLLVALWYWPELGQRTGHAHDQPRMPLVIVEEFENHTADGQAMPLAVELVTDLNLFPDLMARYGGAQAAVTQADMDKSDAIFILSGVVRHGPEGLLYSAILRQMPQAAVLASYEIAAPLGADNAQLQATSAQLAMRLGNSRGPLHETVRAWLDGAGAEDGVFEPYPCMAAYNLLRWRQALIDPVRVEACARQGMGEEDSESTAIVALLTADRGWRLGADLDEGAALLEEGQRLADLAIDFEPISAFNWAARGYVAFLAGEVGSARDFYNTAMQLNPAMIDVMADYAYINALLGDWPLAQSLATRILEAEADPPDFYHTVPTLEALRRGDYARAIAQGQFMVRSLPELGAAVMVAAGGALRDANVVNAYMPRLLASERYRRLGILPALRQRIADSELMRRISSGILSAGMPLDRLTDPF